MDDFYPRSPCGERLRRGAHIQLKVKISIHALLAESDAELLVIYTSKDISIHALLAESDNTSSMSAAAQSLFLSTLSLRRATLRRGERGGDGVFLSTLSLRRATAKVHKTVGHFCAYETNFMGIASSC